MHNLGNNRDACMTQSGGELPVGPTADIKLLGSFSTFNVQLSTTTCEQRENFGATMPA